MELQIQRTIKIISTLTNKTEELNTSATTFTTLKPELGNLDGMKVTILNRDTNERIDEANETTIIPKNAAIFLLPKEKNKSGIDYSTLSYNGLRKLVKDNNLGSGLSSSPTKQSLIDILSLNVKSQIKTKTISEAKERIKDTIEKIQEIKKELEKPFDVNDAILKIKNSIFNQLDKVVTKAVITLEPEKIEFVVTEEIKSLKEFKVENVNSLNDDELMSEFLKLSK